MRAGACIHYTGIQNKVCKMGISYATIAARPLACIFEAGRKAHPDFCPHYTEPTAEQIAADEAEVDAAIARMLVVMAAIRPWRTWTHKNRVAKEGTVECPVCKGKLHLSQAAYNGHVWGKCETNGCVEWMQ